MFYIEATIKPGKVGPVREALSTIGLDGMNGVDVKGFGRQLGTREMYRGAEYSIHLIPKVRLEIAVPSDKLETAVALIQKAAHTETIGAGKIFVYEIEQVLDIRTRDYGPNAL